jgi:hypothetical protein
MSRELLKRALSKLLVLSNTDIRNQETDELIEEIEQMLSKTLPEPVGYCFGKYCGGIVWSSTPPDERKSWLPLYAEPPARKALTDEDIESAYAEILWRGRAAFFAGVRFAEEKHCITN